MYNQARQHTPALRSHVRDLVKHYASEMADSEVLSILENGLKNEEEAKHLGHFIWKMIDQMAEDKENSKVVLGGINNTSMLPDVSYEMDIFMAESGYSKVWEEISDNA
ncbi:hypothetical protein [Microbulbifer rhizosphaerae]|uniref:Phosphoribosyl 1,2-cyclic phosphodiesterase n=1 Tax=Microbulbifer rhizosphaerae TaxID=1562603 RepID=A0A7W4WFL1_9GAMM|nr:hypothetical protein [Microbulbifer rhizosphaerae]MBB3063287.1 phosphoribosyl 1,2-cyclic phosphodiesterase [Microbulbifer rhizosphaerae]